MRTLLIFLLLASPAWADVESDARARAALAYAASLRMHVSAEPAPQVAIDVTQWHVPTPDERLHRGWHWHYDPVTNLWLQHGPENNGNRNAHRGLKGNLVWEQAPPPRFVYPNQQTQQTTTDCPPGSLH